MSEAFSDLNAQASPSATQSIDPRKWLTPGWYWADLREQDVPAYSQFTRQNASVHPTKSVGKGEGFTWVLFQVTGTSPVIYTPPGLAYPALKGANMEVQDYVSDLATLENASGIQSPANDFEAFWKKLMGQLGTAGQVVLWGGVAILLWQVFQKTGGGTRREARGARDEHEYEEREEHHVTTRSPRSGPRTRRDTLVSYR